MAQKSEIGIPIDLCSMAGSASAIHLPKNSAFLSLPPLVFRFLKFRILQPCSQSSK
uniref:Uncharacterized protein n=1 Tax=Meloidogyne incognita TaxID=6306 RepID=A0A914KXZ7_MELIC